jgi:hypothetical protein
MSLNLHTVKRQKLVALMCRDKCYFCKPGFELFWLPHVTLSLVATHGKIPSGMTLQVNWVLMNLHWQFGGVVWQEVPESHQALQHISQQVLSNLKLVSPQTVQKTN